MHLRLNYLTALVFFLWLTPLAAQLNYTEPVYEMRTEEDLYWGVATDYGGQIDTLRADLFKPVRDDNCRRPLLLMIHGGAWIAGTRKDPEVRNICTQMARRGYAVASIEYRLGFHKRAGYTPYAACPLDPCLYAADSSEIRRAVFRGMQDAKGALRYLAGRQELDSTDLDNVFIGGVSAGAFIALQAALLDLPAEKPAETFALPLAPAADPDLAGCNDVDTDYSRPDLGPIEGDLHGETPTPPIRGVAAFMGGLFDDLLPGVEAPAIYLYHQSNDLVVGCNQARPLSPLFQFCVAPLNLCQPLTPFPIAEGSCALNNQLAALGPAAPPYFADLINNGGPNGFTCLADPPTHSIVNIPLRCQNLAGLFAPLIAASGNVPGGNCPSATAPERESASSWHIYPNPCRDEISIQAPVGQGGDFTLEVFNVLGFFRRQTYTGRSPKVAFHFPDEAPSGYYWLRFTSQGEISWTTVIRQ